MYQRLRGSPQCKLSGRLNPGDRDECKAQFVRFRRHLLTRWQSPTGYGRRQLVITTLELQY